MGTFSTKGGKSKITTKKNGFIAQTKLFWKNTGNLKNVEDCLKVIKCVTSSTSDAAEHHLRSSF